MSIDLPLNRLKRALRGGDVQIGLWSCLASPVAAEIVPGSGVDWLLLDTEHAPSDVARIHRQLQAIPSNAANPARRPARHQTGRCQPSLPTVVQ